MQTAFCSNQQSTSESGRSLTVQPKASASASAIRMALYASLHWPTSRRRGQASAGHCAQRQIVQPEFSAGKGQNDRIRRCQPGKLGVVAAGGPGAVAAAHQKEVTDLPAFHGRNDLIGVGEHSAPRKAGGDRFCRRSCRDDGILRVAAQFQRFPDDGVKSRSSRCAAPRDRETTEVVKTRSA